MPCVRGMFYLLSSSRISMPPSGYRRTVNDGPVVAIGVDRHGVGRDNTFVEILPRKAEKVDRPTTQTGSMRRYRATRSMKAP
jgi:hypothetical protein